MKLAVFFASMVLATQTFGQSANSWVKKSDFAGFKREQAVAFSIGNRGYVGTGVDTSETVLNDLWEYNPDLDTWTQKANLLGSARRNAVGFAIENFGYIATGIDNDEATIGVKLNDLWQYNPASNTWVQKANYPGGNGGGVYYATAFTVDQKGYICAGKIGPNNYIDELWEYKPTIDQWAQRSDFPGGVRYNLSSLTIGLKAYVGLGTDQDAYRYDWWEYHPGTNQWSEQVHFIGGQRGGASTYTIGNKGYVCLGTNGGLKKDLYVFDPENQSWYPRANFGGSERKQAISFTLGNSAYVGTGSGVDGKKGSMYQYYPLDVLSLHEDLVTLAIYPNPSIDQITIENTHSYWEKAHLYGADGQKLATFEGEHEKIICSRNELPAGNYQLVLEDKMGNIGLIKKILFID